MGLFKSKNARLADNAIQQTRKFGGDVADRAGAAIDDGSSRLKNLIDELQAVLTSKNVDTSSVRDSLRGTLDKVRSTVSDRRDHLSHDFSEALETADEFARQKPWQVIGAVAGIALVIGFLAGRS